MSRFAAVILPILLAAAGPPPAHPYPQSGRIVSEHVWVKTPVEREWLGRDSIVELERAWRILHRWTGEKLPRLLTVEIAWDRTESSIGPESESITIGMGSPAARAAPRDFLIHAAAREMAFYGLAEQTRGSLLRDDLRALGEGMAEILAREYGYSARALTGAWTMAHLLDRIRPLSLRALADWPGLSGGRRDLRASAPAITLLLTCMEMAGRERTLKLFEALRKLTVEEAIASALKQHPAAIEETWLRKVRSQKLDSDVTATSSEDLPAFRQATYVPRPVRAGARLELQLVVDDAGRDLSHRSVFVVDETSGRVLEGSAWSDRAGRGVRVEIPIESGRRPGEHAVRAVAIDEAGNVRGWAGAYTTVPGDPPR